MSQRAAATNASSSSSSSSQPASTAGEAILTPASTQSETSRRGSGVPISNLRDITSNEKMDEKQADDSAAPAENQEHEQPLPVAAEPEESKDGKKLKSKKKGSCHNASHKKKRKVAGKSGEKKSRAEDSSDEDSASESDSEDGSSEDEDEDDRGKRKSKKSKAAKKVAKEKKRKRAAEEGDESDEDSSDLSDSEAEEEPKKQSKKSKAKKAKDKKSKRKAKQEESSDSESSESDSDDSSSEDDLPKRKKKAGKKSRKAVDSDDESSDEDKFPEATEDVNTLQAQIDALNLRLKAAEKHDKKKSRSGKRRMSSEKKSKRKSSKKSGSGSTDYKRVDQLWDSTIHNYKLKESAEEDETEFAEYAFLVRRCFNWENKYTETVVDIKSKQLRAVLAVVMKDCKSVSLEAEEPTIDPNILFLYIEELRTYYKKTLKAKIKSEKKRKTIKKLEQQRLLCKTLVAYLDEDYADIKKTLYPLLEAGNITFDLMWALFKPNEIAITSCYGHWDEPRCFKVDYATKFQTMQVRTIQLFFHNIILC
jgi:hypothetical protein